jgi:hypothetical protein
MDRRRIAFTLGTAAGGLLGAAFLPVTVAVADEFDYTNYDLTPNSTDVIEDGGIRNFLQQVPPGVEGSAQGYQTFEVTNPTTNADLGTINADVTTDTESLFGNTNELILVTGDPADATAGNAPGDVPPVGSILDTYTYTSGYSAIYTDIPTASGDQISYTWDTPLGDFKIPTSYDALEVKPYEVDGGAGFTGDTFQPVGMETIDGTNGLPPADYDVLGTQTFDVYDGNTEVGSFTADVANSSDIFGNYTQDMLVTSSSGDAPAVGTVYDYFDSNNGNVNIYSDTPSTSGGADTVNDTIVTQDGTDLNLPTSFDAANGLDSVLDGKSDLATGIDVPNSYDITVDPDSTGTIVAIDGIQPEDVDVQGYQTFDWTDGSNSGTLTGDVSESSYFIGNTTEEQIVVTSSTGDGAPGDGSVFEVDNYGNGYESVYSDVVESNGTDKITDTFVTPFGSFNIPDTYDASASLTGDSFQTADPASSSSTLAADLVNLLDPSAASSSIDPAAGVDAASLIDPGAHVDALVNLLTGLF